MQSIRRGLLRRIAPLALVPLALASVRAGYANSLRTAAVLHPADGGAVAGSTGPEGDLLFVNPPEAIRRDADAIRGSRPADAALLDRIASQPQATWVGNWDHDPRGTVARLTTQATSRGAVPVLVAYNIPNRDCGSYSAGGAGDAQGYARWIRDFASGLEGRHAIVVLEPDAVAQASCLSPQQRDARLANLRDAVAVLKANGARVYVDAGNARWLKPAESAGLLMRSGLDKADGFSLNVSNYISTAENIRYGEQISALTGNKHFIIDTGRNGAGTNGEWCNPLGRALGENPTTDTGHPLVDALLWVKPPGQSDGSCNGGPPAGAWWGERAIELARNQPAQFVASAHTRAFNSH